MNNWIDTTIPLICIFGTVAINTLLSIMAIVCVIVIVVSTVMIIVIWFNDGAIRGWSSVCFRVSVFIFKIVFLTPLKS